MLVLQQVSRHFQGLVALNKVDMTVKAGQITGLIGPNGAGKTTLLNCISGLDHPTSGEIRFVDTPIQRLKAHRVAALGLTRTYQNIRLFKEMTVLQNVIVAQHLQSNSTVLHSILQVPFHFRQERRIRETGMAILEQFRLADVQNVPAGTLSYGQQRRLEMARAMITKPRLILLDEPTAGMNPVETEELGEKILEMREMGITVLVVEHDMSLISQVCDYVYVLNFGTILTHDEPEAVKSDPAVIEAYLGKDDE